MDEYHKKGITRRDLMMFGAASAAAGVAARGFKRFWGKQTLSVD